jgi:hypothetical protein
MAQEKITDLPVLATIVEGNDVMLVSKETAPGIFESQKIDAAGLNASITAGAGVYDSGWKVIPDYNGSYGKAPIATNVLGTYQPSIRIVDRIVYFAGLLILPLSSTADGQTLAGNYQTYDTVHIDQPWLYRGLDGGFEKTVNGNVNMRNPILPSELWPTTTTILEGSDIINRSLKFQGTERFPLQAFIGATFITTSGEIGIVTTDAIQGNGNANFQLNSPLEALCSKYLATDLIPDYDLSRSGFAGITDLRNPVPGGYAMGMDIDTTDGFDLGGFYIRLNSNWGLDPNTPIALIKAAFDAL